MTQEDKELLLKDLCARLPYGVKLKVGDDALSLDMFHFDDGLYKTIEKVITAGHRMHLRPMSSMTKEEYTELRKMTITSPNLETAVTLFWEHYYDEAPNWRNDWTCCTLPKVLDWLNVHHFDYRGLISKGLALEAPEEMYGKI